MHLAKTGLLALTVGLALETLQAGAAPAQPALNVAPLRVDASAVMVPASAADFVGGRSLTPGGSTIGVTDRYLTLNGRPWLPVMGELHFSRVPEAEWEDEILKMKSAGVDIISTYVIWIHHEEVEGVWDWSGQRDLRRFAELCRKHGMMLYPRIGPWAHGEARNGGLPDWVVAGGPIRQLDPRFIAETRTLYQQISQELKGELWKDGGPVIGVQIENEYGARGPGKGEEYMLALKRMAIETGMDVPLYTVTGWDGAAVPAREMLPVYGGYPDAPWGSSRTELPPPEVYAFRFGSRVSGSMGMIGTTGAGAAKGRSADAPQPPTPFLTAEMGGGIEGTYHRRPVVSAEDIAAMMPVMLGSGVNGYGTYMFHGGENPSGKLSSLQESQATHYPTDVPEKSYDFQAPIGEFGLERPSLRLLKNWDYLLNDFGSLLAPMPAYAPAMLPAGPEDLSVLRWSVRTDGRKGFLFVNNHVREHPMPSFPGTQFAVALPGGRVQRIPEMPVDLPSGASFAWPFGLELGPVTLRYGTAQLMARLHDDAGPTFVFACVKNVRCELAMEGASLDARGPKGIRIEHRASATLVGKTAASDSLEPVTVRTSTGATVRLLLLSSDDAANTWKVPGEKTDHLLQTTADVFVLKETVTLRQLGSAEFRFAVYPSTPSLAAARRDGHTFVADVPTVTVALQTKQLKAAGVAPPIGLGPSLDWRPTGVAQAPASATWQADAARWSVQTPAVPLSAQMPDLFLRIAYTGDAARLATGNRLLDDNFFDGEPWLVGLKRFTRDGVIPPLELLILPMRADAPVYLPAAAQARIAKTGQTVALEEIKIVPQYQMQVPLGGMASTTR